MLLALVGLTAGASAEPGLVEVTVSGVRSDRGEVLVAICDRASFLEASCAYRGRVAARRGSVLVQVRRVPAGQYAAQAFHDENGNGRIDRSWLGVPTEGIGFSRDARMRFGPPRFDDAAFSVDETASIAVSLHYYE